MKADEINAQLTASPDNHPYPFDHIVYTNIGNPHSVGQKGLTWPRQVMSLVDLPSDVGVNHPLASKMFPSDTIERARSIKKALNGYGIGAYTHSQGPSVFREEICKFIEERDDLEEGSTNPANIFMTNGASSGIEMILDALIASSTTYVNEHYLYHLFVSPFLSNLHALQRSNDSYTSIPHLQRNHRSLRWEESRLLPRRREWMGYEFRRTRAFTRRCKG